MLQQTQAARVAPLYVEFLRRFPTIHDLAAATPAEVLGAWAGLGYNRRAVALLDAATEVVAKHGGRLPREEEALRRLPGVGPYTAAAVASIGYGVPVAAVDTNVRRVVARALLGSDPEQAQPARVSALAAEWLDRKRPGAWNQAVMDLGREVCRPVPRCESCPISARCAYRGRVSSGQANPRGRAHRRSGRAQQFAGSFRQLRGAIVRELRHRSPVSVDALVDSTGQPLERVMAAVQALSADRLVVYESGVVRFPHRS